MPRPFAKAPLPAAYFPLGGPVPTADLVGREGYIRRAGARLADLEAEHPRPEVVGVMLQALGVELTVTESARPALIATIEGPNGTVVLT